MVRSSLPADGGVLDGAAGLGRVDAALVVVTAEHDQTADDQAGDDHDGGDDDRDQLALGRLLLAAVAS